MNLPDKLFSLFQRDVFLFLTTTLTGVVIARTLGPEMMGLWTLLMLVPGYAEAFGRLKLDVASIYFLGKKRASLGEMTLLLNAAALVTSSLLIALVIAQFDYFYQILYKNSSIDMRLMTFACLFLIPLRLVYVNYSYLLIFKEDIKAYNITVMIQALFTSATTIILIIVFQAGIFGALIGSFFGVILAILYGMWKLQKDNPMSVRFDLKLLIEMFKYSFFQYVGGILAYFQSTSTNLLAATFVLPAQVGFYSVGKSLAEVSTRMVPTAVNALLFPRISKSDDPLEASLLTARSYRITLLILSAMALGIAPLIYPIVLIMYGRAYIPMIGPFLILLPGFVLLQTCSVFTSYFSGIGRSDLLVKISIAPLAIQLVAALLLMPAYGIVGGACSVLVSIFFLTFFQIVTFLQVSKVPLATIVPSGADFQYIWSFAKQKIAFF